MRTFPLTYLTLTLIMLIACAAPLFAQEAGADKSHRQLRVEIDAGGSVPVDAAVNDVFHLGMNMNLGLAVAVKADQRLWIKPVAGLKWYFKTLSAENSLTEQFRTWKAGLEGQYVLAVMHKTALEASLRVDYNWCANYYSQQYDYNLATNTSSVAVSKNFLSGGGLSYGLGLRFRREDFYLKLDYEIFEPTLNVNKDLIKEALAQGLRIPSTRSFNFSSVSLGIGFNLNFSK